LQLRVKVSGADVLLQKLMLLLLQCSAAAGTETETEAETEEETAVPWLLPRKCGRSMVAVAALMNCYWFMLTSAGAICR
jgi:hypothetical protein